MKCFNVNGSIAYALNEEQAKELYCEYNHWEGDEKIYVMTDDQLKNVQSVDPDTRELSDETAYTIYRECLRDNCVPHMILHAED